ncbi:hypothetical protein DSCO28_15770 [Desulfosarcina ovata subsp. sediminis]|uniref:Tripartite ATP-independent periplasmic transporters DctQ component domain-containing protein n=1 Tax=Desulfosarcina ovata subsp. sediminis TaxID=885957 RepID=A0A5K7ZJF3_9BACT|nr:hypothetical protein DSCO28_15770 [Desulfosarcina ovata subsp. sediminis]
MFFFLSDTFHHLGVLLIVFVLLVIVYQIAGRLIRASTFDTVELTSYLLIWITFACLPKAHREGRHIRVDLIYARLSKRTQYALDIFSGLISIMLSAIVVWQGILICEECVQAGDATLILHTPMIFINIALPVGMLLFGIASAEKIVSRSIEYRQNDK